MQEKQSACSRNLAVRTPEEKRSVGWKPKYSLSIAGCNKILYKRLHMTDMNFVEENSKQKVLFQQQIIMQERRP